MLVEPVEETVTPTFVNLRQMFHSHLKNYLFV